MNPDDFGDPDCSSSATIKFTFVDLSKMTIGWIASELIITSVTPYAENTRRSSEVQPAAKCLWKAAAATPSSGCLILH